MKKLIAMLLAMALVVALTACGSTEATVSNEIPNAPTEEPAAGTTQAPSLRPSPSRH